MKKDILLEKCMLCPRNCGVDRYENRGYCNSNYEIKAAKAFMHMWEEPCISGSKGSGTVFFSNCNLGCVFCQNYRISHDGFGVEISSDRLAGIFLELQSNGAHNINLVTPTHYIPQIRSALQGAKEGGLEIPVIYNSNAYENVEALRELEGLIDIYLPDLKYCDDKISLRYSKAPGYFKAASRAIMEMYRQVGTPVFDTDGLLKKGLMIRHLMLPGKIFDSKKVIDWVLENLPKEIYLNIMCQYTPMNNSQDYPELNKIVSQRYYNTLIDYALSKGLENGFVQEMGNATEEYVPDFDLSGI